MFRATFEKRIWLRRHFLDLELRGRELLTQRGKRGEASTVTAETLTNVREAIIRYEQLIARYQREGWTLLSGGEAVPAARTLEDLITLSAVDASCWARGDFGNGAVSAQLGVAPISVPERELARNAKLEAQLLETDADADWRVYADWLADQGDELGVYINQCMDGTPDPELAARLRPLWLGETLTACLVEHRDASFRLQWRRGLVHRAWVSAEFDSGVELGTLVAALLDSPAARFLRELELGMGESDNINTYDALPATFTARAPILSVERLFVGNYAYPEQTEISWTEVGDLSAVLACFPRLREYGVRGGQMQLGKLAHTQLERLTLESGGLNHEALRSVMEAELPRLRELELWLGDVGYGAEASVADLQPLLAGRFAGLEVLRLRNTELSDALVPALAASELLPRLRVLDLSMGTLHGPGVAQLLEHAARFRHLERLDLSDNFLLEAEASALQAAVPGAIVDGQKQPYMRQTEPQYFVSVGE